MRAPPSSSIPNQPALNTIEPLHETVKTDVIDVENPEKTLVVETPEGERDETKQVDPRQTDIDPVTPIQTELDKNDTINDTVPSTLDTPNMPSGMTNIQQLRDARAAHILNWPEDDPIQILKLNKQRYLLARFP